MGAKGHSCTSSSCLIARAQAGVLACAAGALLYTLWQYWTSSSSNSKVGSHTCIHTALAAEQEEGHKQHQQPYEASDQPEETCGTAAAVAAADAARLHGMYCNMAVAFEQQGLDLKGVGDTAYWFDTASDPVAPMFYQDPTFPPGPLPPAAVRLLLVLLSQALPPAAAEAAAREPDNGKDACDMAVSQSHHAHMELVNRRAVEAAVSIIQRLQALLPGSCQVFANPAYGLHITLFHFSHPLDTRPNTLRSSSSSSSNDAAGGRTQQHTRPKPDSQQQALSYAIAADATAGAQCTHSTSCDEASVKKKKQRRHRLAQEQQVLSLPAHLRPGPTEQQQTKERAAAAALAANLQPFTLQLDRVLMTRSGTLLIGWTDPSGRVADMRKQLHQQFPGASSKQSNIIHTSLLRIITTRSQQQQQRQQWRGQQCTGVLSVGDTDAHQQQQQQQQLPQSLVASISRLCEVLSDQYRGVELHVRQVQWVIEEQFSTVQGTQISVPLGHV